MYINLTYFKHPFVNLYTVTHWAIKATAFESQKGSNLLCQDHVFGADLQ